MGGMRGFRFIGVERGLNGFDAQIFELLKCEAPRHMERGLNLGTNDLYELALLKG